MTDFIEKLKAAKILWYIWTSILWFNVHICDIWILFPKYPEHCIYQTQQYSRKSLITSCSGCHINYFSLINIENHAFLLKFSFPFSWIVIVLHKYLRFRSIDPQLVQLYQIIHIHPVTIFNNGAFAETIPSWEIYICLWWLHYHYTTKKMNVKESLWMHVLRELYIILFSHTRQEVIKSS